ncbi:MAG: hypothetical protein NTW03_04100 [Verrucomicrobia bacterium]|nr:hypothetical protein [Verrucomicrobiota bacterium]
MKSKRLLLLVVLGAWAFLATGCEWGRWLRLLSFKKQLANLERYARVEDRHGLTLHFLKPVVYTGDLQLLVEGDAFRTTNQNRQTWLWAYEKQSLAPSASAHDFDLSFTAIFENDKFTELRFPERFLAVLPKPLILGMLRSLGRAEIDMKHGTANVKWVGGGQDKVDLPAEPQLTALLGPPFTVTESNLTRTFLYKYYEKAPSPQAPAEKLAWATFTFAGDSDRVLASQGVFGNMKWTMTATPGQPEMLITVSLVPPSVEPVALTLPATLTDEYIGQYKESGGMVMNIGRDGGVFAASWNRKDKGGWGLILPETTNVLFALPWGDPRCTFMPGPGGSITGLVAHLNGSEPVFAKVTNQLHQTPPLAQVPPEVCQACAGTYKASWGGRIIIGYQGGQLVWHDPGVESKLPLYPSSATNFFFKAVDSPLTFIKNDQGAVTKFILHFYGRTAEGQKVKGS